MPITSALCCTHGRRGFYDLTALGQLARHRPRGKIVVTSPITVEVVRRIVPLFHQTRR